MTSDGMISTKGDTELVHFPPLSSPTTLACSFVHLFDPGCGCTRAKHHISMQLIPCLFLCAKTLEKLDMTCDP